MTVLALRRKTDPWWDLDGDAARRARFRRRLKGDAAFLIAEIAIGLTMAMWLLRMDPGLNPFIG